MESTREMPDTAASPVLVTMTVSAMPMVTASSCSITRGMIRRRSALRGNIGSWFTVSSAK